MFKNNHLRTNPGRALLTLLVGATLAVATMGVRAEIVTLASILSADNEVPPVTTPSSGAGEGFFVLDTDTNLFTWSITFENLTGPLAAAHIHTQAAGTRPGAAAGPIVINLVTDAGVVEHGSGQSAGTFLGRTTLGATGGLLDRLWYVNIHTELNPAGEIRGQILPGGVTVVPLPAAAWLLLSALGLVAIRARSGKKSA